MNALGVSPEPKAFGLEGLIVAETRLSHVEGNVGKLSICGFDVDHIVDLPFESACFLLWNERLPQTQEIKQIRHKFAEARQHFYNILPRNGPKNLDCMDYMRWALSYLDEKNNFSIAAALCVAAAVWYRSKQDLKLIEPDPNLGHAQDYLRMISGNHGDPDLSSALNSYLVTVSDHGMNASTFALRVVASTGSDLKSGVIAAMAALKGPLHGGAPEPVLDMFKTVQSPDKVNAWIDERLQNKKRIMGMGHRQYRVRDPRVNLFEIVLKKIEKKGRVLPLLPIARAIEKEATRRLSEKYPDRPMRANVEFYTALLLDACSIPPELFTATFAIGRVAGWCAHFNEQQRYGKLIYPDATYIGR